MDKKNIEMAGHTQPPDETFWFYDHIFIRFTDPSL